MPETDRGEAVLQGQRRKNRKRAALLNTWTVYPVLFLHLGGGNLSESLSLVVMRWWQQQQQQQQQPT